MVKTYFNDAVVGNSSMLACVSADGELLRLFWPNIDYPQHIDKMAVGIFFPERRSETLWLESNSWLHEQRYITDTNMLETCFESRELGIRAVQLDFVLLKEDILIRRYRVKNMTKCAVDIGFMVYSSVISSTKDMGCTLFDFDTDALIHYRYGSYMSVFSDIEACEFQVGNNAFDSAKQAELRKGFDSIGMAHDGAVSWKLGRLSGGEARNFTLYICLSHTLKEVKRLTAAARTYDVEAEIINTEKYWHDYIKSAKYIDLIERVNPERLSDIKKEDILDLYKRSLLVFKLMSDANTGGILAAPELDEGFTRSGGYAYCWGRDAAFITEAFDKCGLTYIVDRFYDWAVRTQDENGAWHQRYHMNGTLAPSWGLQIDETGTLLWGMLKHYGVTKDRDFLLRMWDSVKRGVEFLISFIDRDTGLPAPSYDLWEERFGEHAYSSAAVCSGIKAGAEIAGIIGAPPELISRWQEASESIKQSIERVLWNEELGRFIRSVRTKLNPWGDEYSEKRIVMQVNPKGYCRELTLEDWTVDVSLLGVAIPFGVFDVDDIRVRSTAETIERVLASLGTGGIKRYENDTYVGGNPWIVTTLWLAVYHIKVKNWAKALKYFEWAVKSRTGLGLLPEQVNKDTGRPAWVIPLTWSHAMFVLTLTELLDLGILL